MEAYMDMRGLAKPGNKIDRRDIQARRKCLTLVYRRKVITTFENDANDF